LFLAFERGRSHQLACSDSVLADSDQRLERALEIIAINAEGQMQVKLVVPTHCAEEFHIRWTTTCASSTAAEPNMHPASSTRTNQDSATPLISPEPNPTWGRGADEYCSDHGGERTSGGVGEYDYLSEGSGDEEVCAVCLSRAPDCALRPCGHARCCRRCVVETVCTWRQAGPPRCALCRAPFHTMEFID
jgi:hypothetical protein